MRTARRTPDAPPVGPRPIEPPQLSFSLREARPPDAGALSELLGRLVAEAYPDGDRDAVAAWASTTYGPAAMADRIARNDCFVLVAVDRAGHIHGASCAELRRGPHATDALLTGTYLSPSARGQGLMVDAYAAVVAWLQRRGARRVLAYVHAENSRGRALLEVVGFVHRADTPGALVPGMAWCQMTADVPRRADAGGPDYWVVPF